MILHEIVGSRGVQNSEAKAKVANGKGLQGVLVQTIHAMVENGFPKPWWARHRTENPWGHSSRDRKHWGPRHNEGLHGEGPEQ
jgi:hypothetical protein